MTTFFPVENLLASYNENPKQYSIDESVIKKIDLAQRDHISVDFKNGVVRVILENIDSDVEEYTSTVDVKDGSFAQYVASCIADERNLQSHVMFRNDRFSLVVVSQLDGPKDSIDRLNESLKNCQIK